MNDEHTSFEATGFACPLPLNTTDAILLAHGGGGSMSRDLVERYILPAFRNAALEPLHDGAVLDLEGCRIAFTTDSFVMDPLFVPGTDIGAVAVNGTVNDLCMCGAAPLAISAAFIIEEGLAFDVFSSVLASMQRAASLAGVSIVTGDTKVVERGKADKLFITTSGIGLIPEGIRIAPGQASPGDAILLNGPIASHGIAVLSQREGLGFESAIRSDCAALNGLVRDMLAACPAIRVLRDPTRGGVASALNEIAASSGCGILLDERAIPVEESVRAACDLLGFDPLYVANEGKCLAVTPVDRADAVLAAMRSNPLGTQAAMIGVIVADHPGKVVMRTRIGGLRSVEMMSGEQLPRIC
jgi:hydrogenase expression/formation protein HypE